MDRSAISAFVDEMLMTAAFRRIMDVSFLGIVDRYSKSGGEYYRIFSRAEHSLGVLDLAMSVADSVRMTQFDAMTLSAAALTHDLAHPAFSHSLEYAFDKRSRSMNHHVALLRLFDGSDSRSIEVKRVFDRNAVDLKRVISVLSGHDALSFLFENPINIDTIDGISRAIWARGAMAPYNVAVLTRHLAKLYVGDTVSSREFFREADKFWKAKDGFYNLFLSGERASIEASFQTQARRAIRELDYRFFEMSDSDFVQLFPQVLYNVTVDDNASMLTSNSFLIDDKISVVDKNTIYDRYKRVRIANQPSRDAS